MKSAWNLLFRRSSRNAGPTAPALEHNKQQVPEPLEASPTSVPADPIPVVISDERHDLENSTALDRMVVASEEALKPEILIKSGEATVEEHTSTEDDLPAEPLIHAPIEGAVPDLVGELPDEIESMPEISVDSQTLPLVLPREEVGRSARRSASAKQANKETVIVPQSASDQALQLDLEIKALKAQLSSKLRLQNAQIKIMLDRYK